MIISDDTEIFKKRIFSLIDSINRNGTQLLENQTCIIPLTSLASFKLIPPELGFIRSISWLYSIYFEGGKENIKFLTEKFPVYQIDNNGRVKYHKQSINCLRTYFQHDLFEESVHNQEIYSFCKIWYNDCCGKQYPEDDVDWKKCLIHLLEDAEYSLSILNSCIEKISLDVEYRDVIVTQWKLKISRYHQPYEFDRIIESVMHDIGIENLDVIKFRQKNIDSWQKKLDSLSDYDFEVEIRKMIEYDLIRKIKLAPPFNGNDIMKSFQIPPGRLVGELLILGYDLYETYHLPREDLLKLLYEEALKKGLL